MIRVVRLDPIKTPLVNKFYDKHGARGRATKQDDVWVVYSAAEIIAACRIQNRDEHLFLSTLFVDSNWRAQGIAKRLLLALIAEQQKVIFTFAYQSLIDFYRSIGFNFVLTLPPPISTLLKVYQQRNVVALQCQPK
ncbi:GNAT family N-acetyltransferase [Pseudoalteromonas shioyasakiensis]|uniref:GNAT family N-acetyltransferase n=1 Tax=Pseudoalteromonas shioyasakiensis TaxID=1190813 RepID=UPI002118857F|nr:GNAT family N-acetyltransferase [Pseudoalteromonas shioyasakiensis]